MSPASPQFERLMTEAHVCSALLLSEIVLYFILHAVVRYMYGESLQKQSLQWSLCPFSELPL